MVALALTLTSAGCGDDDCGCTESRLRILVTNDDGFEAEGINAMVEALVADPSNDVVVCAPSSERSGTSDSTDCGTLEAFEGETSGGYPATAVDGCPADSVNYALDHLYPPDDPPDVVLSGINRGQNIGNIPPAGFLSQISGTVGAAKAAARRGVPALAASQGLGDPVDFPSGVDEVMAWLAENRAALASGSVSTATIASLNIPSCNQGSIRNPLAPLDVPLATENPNGLNLLGEQDCQAEGIEPDTDVDAFLTGWVTLSPVPVD